MARTFGKVGNDVYEVMKDGTYRHIQLPEFKSLGLNVDHLKALPDPKKSQKVPTGQEQNDAAKKIGLSDATIAALGPEGVATFAGISDVLMKQYEQGNPIPSTFTAQDLDRIFKQAQDDPDIKQYYKDQLNLGREEFQRNAAFLSGDYQQIQEKQARDYALAQQNLQENEAAAGRAYSGFREQAKGRLGEEQAGIIESTRSALKKGVEQLGSQFEKQYGTQNMPSLNIQGVGYNPYGNVPGLMEQQRLSDVRDRENQLRQNESLTRGLTTQ